MHTIESEPPARSLVKSVSAMSIGATLLAIVATSAFFWFFPTVDLLVSGLFYVSGSGFVLSHQWPFKAIREVGIYLTWLFAGGTAVALLVGIASRGRCPVLLRAGTFLASVLLLGPGLIANLILKDHWGRARPNDILDFGGQFPYSKVWVIAHNCTQNCSFVSGEASSSFALLAIAFVVPPAYRLMTAIVTLLTAFIVSADRIIFGGHFLSDTLLSWLLVLLVMLFLDRLINRIGWLAAT